jgi:hypothetical protein
MPFAKIVCLLAVLSVTVCEAKVREIHTKVCIKDTLNLPISSHNTFQTLHQCYFLLQRNGCYT